MSKGYCYEAPDYVIFSVVLSLVGQDVLQHSIQ
jgi:hypothetical protein